MIFIDQRELDQWRKENRSLQLELRHEESLTAQAHNLNHIYILIQLNKNGDNNNNNITQ